jgi:hypothetical protein
VKRQNKRYSSVKDFKHSASIRGKSLKAGINEIGSMIQLSNNKRHFAMKTLRIPFTILCVLAMSALSAQAAQLATAKVLEVTGIVTKYTEAGTKTPLKAGEILKQGDSLSAARLSNAKLVFSNGSEITIKENSSLNIAKLEQASFGNSQSYEQLQADPSKSQTLLELNYGEVGFHVKKLQPDSSFNIETPLGTAAVRGTQGFVKLLFNAERGEFMLVVKNFDGLVDIISRYAGNLEFSEGKIGDKGYDGSASNDKAEPLPKECTVIIRLNSNDPYFDDIIDIIKNVSPVTPTPTPSPIPTPEVTPEDPGVIVVSPEDQAPV